MVDYKNLDFLVKAEGAMCTGPDWSIHDLNTCVARVDTRRGFDIADTAIMIDIDRTAASDWTWYTIHQELEKFGGNAVVLVRDRYGSYLSHMSGKPCPVFLKLLRDILKPNSSRFANLAEKYEADQKV